MKPLPLLTEKEESKSSRGYILDTLIQGFVILLPLTIILILISVVFNFIFGIVAPLTAILDPGSDNPHWFVNFISLGILILFIFLIGIIIKNNVGKKHFGGFEKKYLAKIPLYSLIHQTVYQFIGIKKLPLSEVVLIDPFKTGTLMTGFVTDRIGENLYTVFVPTAPNPMNGNIYHVPKASISFLNVRTQDAMRTIMSMGTGSSTFLTDAKIEDINNKITISTNEGQVPNSPSANID